MFQWLFARNAVEECVQFPLDATLKHFSGKILRGAFVFRFTELRSYGNRSAGRLELINSTLELPP